MVEYREGIAHADSLAQKSQHRVLAFTKIKFQSRGGQDEKITLESNLQGVLAQQRRVSELRGCKCGRWGSEGSGYVVDGHEQSRRLGCCTVISTAENPAVYGMHWQRAHYAAL